MSSNHLISVLFVFLLLTSCSSVPVREKAWLNNYYYDDSFTKEAISEGKLTLAGVTGNYSNVNQEKIRVLNNIVDCSIKRYVHADSINSPTFIENELGVKLYKNILNNFHVEGNLNSLNVEDYEKLKCYGRYIVFYKILDNEVSNNKRSTDDQKCYYSKRKVTAQINIYDVERNKNVWGGELSKKIDNENCNSTSEPESDNLGAALIESFIGAVVDSVFDAAFGTYPEPPSISRVFGSVAIGFAENLPGAEVQRYK